ncbi:putative receptor-like protein kinase At5g18500, partial [Bidens hawaiensis]|uniref:putative receptor-like protein kinase At5g18500 n=1 Tax=Bidens hawaiensis TaxID=980011 RepID=UPI004049AAE7
ENNKDSLQIPLEEIKLATNNFSQKNFIGGGGFGNVYKGEVANGNETTTIVAKRLDRTRGQGEGQFLMELEILFDYKHDKIISLEGYCNEDGEKIIVCEYASKGSLDSHLNNVSLTWSKRLRICIDIARRLAFLHDRTDPAQEMVIHRDIKSANILLNADWKAKISDFGLSVITSINQEEVHDVVGTIGYVDPQYVHTGFFSEKSDIYSLGVVLFEILHGSVIYRRDYNQTHLTRILEHIHEEEKLGSIVFEDIKGQIDPKSLSTFRVIVSQCLDNDREKRPTAKEVLQQLEESLKFQVSYIVLQNWLPFKFQCI